MSWINQMSRKAIQNAVAYDAGIRNKSSKAIYLNANENPYPREYALQHKFNRYPEPQPHALLSRYAKFLGITADHILVTLGGDSSIELLIKAFCEPHHDKLLYAPPTFGMYQIGCNLMDIETIQVPLNDDFSLNVEAILAKIDHIKMIILCSPNNPTGNLMDRDALLTIIEATKNRAIVVLDEAYIEFSKEQSFVTMLKQYPHLILIRTLSKAFGLAGIRCGFTVANPEVINVLRKVIAPYPIPVPVIDIALEALSDEGITYMYSVIERMNAERERMKAEFKALSLVKNVYNSDANWLLVRFNQSNALFQYLLENEIYVRNQSHSHLKDAFRISIGKVEENNALLEAIKQFMKKI